MMTVLVVDDHATNREIVRQSLGRGGYQVIEAGDGPRALTIAKATRPCLIVTDVLMPGMDGYEFVHNLRADPDTAGIPVVFYTAHYREDEVKPLAEIFGVSQVVSKSADPSELLDVVAEAIGAHPTPISVAEDTIDARHLHAVNAKLVEKAQALEESEARFRVMAEASPIGIVIGDIRGAASYVNPRLSEIMGVPVAKLLGDGWLCCLSPECRAALRAERGSDSGSNTGEVRYHMRIIVPSGDTRWLTVLVQSIEDSERNSTGFVAMIDDVTAEAAARERRRAEEQQRETEARRQMTARFESLARLAGGVAHDFNNLLNIIMSSDELVRESIMEARGVALTDALTAELLSDLDQIHRAGQRAAHLTHQLLTFGGREAAAPTVVDPNAVVVEVRNMISGTIGKRIVVSTQLEPHLRRVVVDGSQLSRILLNLATNARDAMPDGGQLFLRTANVRVDAVGQVDGLPVGEFVHLAITDTGKGMPPDVVEHAIEPFYTTKPSGHGTGLGLATAYGVVTRAGGQLIIDSAVDRGTTIHLYLPATSQRSSEEERPVADTPVSTGHTVLLVEDDDRLRDLVTRLLTGAGYRVLDAASGSEALAIAECHDGAIDAMLTDMAMPAMNGRELAEALQQVRPDVPVLFMSGFAAPIMAEQGMLDADAALLDKPFTKSKLLDALHATLIGRPNAPVGGG